MNLQKLVTISLFLLALGEAHSQVATGPLTNAANGHWYYLVGPTDWTNAEAQAVALGGHLVTINDAAENDWVLQNFGSFGNLFIGFTDAGQEGQWGWISREPVTYTNWNAGEPNNGFGAFPYENCSAMYGGTAPPAGRWNDIIGFGADQHFFGIVEVTSSLLSIRVSQVELCWPTVTGVVYQVQYQSSLTTNAWVSMGSQVVGTGTSVCRTDDVLSGEPKRFYRVVPVP